MLNDLLKQLPAIGCLEQQPSVWEPTHTIYLFIYALLPRGSVLNHISNQDYFHPS